MEKIYREELNAWFEGGNEKPNIEDYTMNWELRALTMMVSEPKQKPMISLEDLDSIF